MQKIKQQVCCALFCCTSLRCFVLLFLLLPFVICMLSIYKRTKRWKQRKDAASNIVVHRCFSFLSHCCSLSIASVSVYVSLYLCMYMRFMYAKTGKKMKAKKEDVAKFRQTLSRYGDIFVNDAFGTAHRAHRFVWLCYICIVGWYVCVCLWPCHCLCLAWLASL